MIKLFQDFLFHWRYTADLIGPEKMAPFPFSLCQFNFSDIPRGERGYLIFIPALYPWSELCDDSTDSFLVHWSFIIDHLCRECDIFAIEFFDKFLFSFCEPFFEFRDFALIEHDSSGASRDSVICVSSLYHRNTLYSVFFTNDPAKFYDSVPMIFLYLDTRMSSSHAEKSELHFFSLFFFYPFAFQFSLHEERPSAADSYTCTVAPVQVYAIFCCYG